MRLWRSKAAVVFAMLSWEDEWGLFDSGTVEQALTEGCVRYVDQEIAEPGDGSSWERAMISVEDVVEFAREAVGDEERCEIRVAGEVEDRDSLEFLAPASGNIKVVKNYNHSQ